MTDLVIKYLTGESTSDEGESILLAATEYEPQRNDFFEFNNLLAHLSLLPHDEDDIEAQKSLLHFLNKIIKKDD